MAITMREIAKQASVSQTTASLILNGGKASSRFSDETAERVRSIAAQMGYRKNRTAAILRNQKNCLIGVLSGGYRMESFGGLLEGVSKTVEPKYGIVPAVHHYDGLTERHCLQMFVDMRLSGVIAFWSGDEESIPVYRDLVERYGISVVLCDFPIPSLELPCLAADNLKLAYLAVSTLLDCGHRKILGLIFQQPNDGMTDILMGGYYKAMAEYKMQGADVMTSPFATKPVYSKEYVQLVSLYVNKVIERLQYENFKYTAIWAQDDLIAYDLMFKLNKLGIRVPEDISLIGIGNRESSNLPQINLSSVASESFVENGKIISKALLGSMESNKTPTICLERKLKVFLRNSIRKIKLV
jgi:DNA-binding LacI/PurR family transcriptional regulator